MAESLEQTGDFRSMDQAPKDGRLVIGRDADGSCHLMRWRSRARTVEEDGPDDQAEHPYWARWKTDTRLEPTEWAPTALTEDDVLDRV